MDCTSEADVVIETLMRTGRDYTSYRSEISSFFYEYLYGGNWDGTLDFSAKHVNEPEVLPAAPSLRFIQEDEFDQHRSDDMPEWDDQLCYASGHYIFEVK